MQKAMNCYLITVFFNDTILRYSNQKVKSSYNTMTETKKNRTYTRSVCRPSVEDKIDLNFADMTKKPKKRQIAHKYSIRRS